ncbi:ubiquinol-cytochrome c reductase cytochrome b subunit [Haloechinothrix salitolerans]|uniref:Cytochrome bc1 complex cytochrome b subunit n=1 Tax=Haloechinothrix salitolerans TaxID=926830 RepID=A0ABW2C281_9PSEU
MSQRRSTSGTAAGKLFDVVDERFPSAGTMRHQVNKVFQKHWSFLLGEVALYSFFVLLLSGTYLAWFFDPSMEKVTYDGSYTMLRGIEMSRAYESTLDISFEVRGGLLARQIHHWAALVFVAAIVTHMGRIFFTGAFRKPREVNWVIGVLLLTIAIMEGFTGYSLPDDLLSGTGLRITSGIVLSIPVVGTWLHWLVFGGEYAGEEIIPRLFTIHILLLPGLLLALIGVHLAIVWYQKHTQFPGRVSRESNAVGVRVLPGFAAKSGSLFTAVTGLLAAMGGLLQINPIWNYGPYKPSHVSAGSQPDWYLIWVDGAARLWPAWEIPLVDYRIPAVMWPTVITPTLLVGAALCYPWIDRALTKDYRRHNILERPRDAPVRTGLGAMVITFVLVLLASGVNDILAHVLEISLNGLLWAGRIGIVFLPLAAYLLTYHVCRALQRDDRKVLEEGMETGIIRRYPHGHMVDVHQPLATSDGEAKPLPYAGTPVPKKANDLGLAGSPVPGGLLRPDPPPDRERERGEDGETSSGDTS